MIPKTKLQKQVIELSSTLPEITEEQKEWAYKHCFESKGYKCKGEISCMCCGYQWKDSQPPLLTTLDGSTCPNCKTKLKITNSRKQKDKQSAYYCIITTCKGFQVIRFFDIYGYYAKGKLPHYGICEIVQHWMSPDGKYETVARLRGAFPGYTDTWSWYSPMEIRSKNGTTCYSLIPSAIYPKMKCTPTIKRNGFRNSFHGLAPLRMFYLLLTDSKTETLLKAKQYNLLKLYVDRSYKISTYWASIKICIRNHYKLTDPSLWLDYLDALSYFRKDLRNAAYVCPANLKKEHDRWDKKRRIKEEKERVEREKQEAANAEANYRKAKGKFFDLEISDGEILIRPLKSIQEFYDEGKAMHHCVRNYYKRNDSLVLSATKNGERIATIELSLKSLGVLQCRGVCNDKPEHYDQIIELLRNNINLIRRKMNKKERTVSKHKLSA